MKRITVRISCVADRYADKERERIVEFFDPVTKRGGLIDFFRKDNNTLDVYVYHCDPGVVVRAGASVAGGLAAETAERARLLCERGTVSGSARTVVCSGCGVATDNAEHGLCPACLLVGDPVRAERRASRLSGVVGVRGSEGGDV